MISNLFTSAARDLRKHGWTQPSGDNALLFYHPEFGAHGFFKACYIQCNAARLRRRKRLYITACWAGLSLMITGAILLVVAAITGVLL